MSSIEIISKIEALKEWEQLAAEAAAEIESIKDAIKKEMDARGFEAVSYTHLRQLLYFLDLSSRRTTSYSISSMTAGL